MEFIAILLRTGSEVAQQQLVQLGAIQKIIQLFFEYVVYIIANFQIIVRKMMKIFVIEPIFDDCL